MSDNARTKIIHCRVTEAEHQAISRMSREAGLSITQFVIRAAMGKAVLDAHSGMAAPSNAISTPPAIPSAYSTSA